MKLVISETGLNLIKSFEGLVTHTYIDAVGVATIGYGSTMYKDGSKPQIGQVMNQDQATELLLWGISMKAASVGPEILSTLNQNQVDAVLCIVYNIGVGAFRKSTLLKRININSHDQTIRAAFLMWDKGTIDGKLVELPGLKIRRQKEADLYFTPILKS